MVMRSGASRGRRIRVRNVGLGCRSADEGSYPGQQTVHPKVGAFFSNDRRTGDGGKSFFLYLFVAYAAVVTSGTYMAFKK